MPPAPSAIVQSGVASGSSTLTPQNLNLQASTGGSVVPDIRSDGSNIYVEAVSGNSIYLRPHGQTNTSAMQIMDGLIGFFGVAAVARAVAFTIPYVGRSQNLPNDTVVNPVATASTNVAPFGYATAAQADAINAGISALHVDLDIAKSVLASLIIALQAYGLLQ